MDDNADAADTTAMLLQAWGHDPVVAYDGQTGLEMIRRERPDAVLLDIGLPSMSGYDLARRLREEGIAPPLMVAITGYGHEADRQKAEKAGFHHHLVKPARPDDLARLLDAAAKAKAAQAT